MEIKATGFGWIETDRARFDTDVVIYPGGQVETRYRHLRGDNHIVTREEVQRVLAGTNATLVIGSGQYGVLTLDPAAKKFLDDRGITCHLAPTPEAIKIFNSLTGTRAAIFHVTC